MATKVNWEHFKDMFHESWHRWVEPIFNSKVFQDNWEEFKKRAKLEKVYPSSASGNLFRVFREVPFDHLNVVVVGLSPYNFSKNGVEVADGLAFSCSNTKEEQPSLKMWYDAMEEEFGKCERDPDLSYLTKQGIFLYNYALTAPSSDPTGHTDIWKYFSNELFRTAISATDVPVILLGKVAEELQAHIAPWQLCVTLKHPSWAARNKQKWDTEGMFKFVQEKRGKEGCHFNWVKQKEKF